MHHLGLNLDRRVPALLVAAGRPAQHHGAVAVARSLGRTGVPVFAMVEDHFTPVAVSRYLTGHFVAPSSGRQAPRELVDALLAAGRAIGARSVAIALDDDAALLLAEHSRALSEWFLLPRVPAGLPRLLAGKESLHRLCRNHGVPTPRARVPDSRDTLLATAYEWGYPLLLNALPQRPRGPGAGRTVVVHDEAELLTACPPRATPPLMVQEYIPGNCAEDWITHLHCAEGGEASVVFTGVKLRSWPLYTGITTRARARPNPYLAQLSTALCRHVGYSRVADLDWRFDRRDGQYKLVDFHPRTGAQFRLFETEEGVDVVRALHLDLTGRAVPPGRQIMTRTFAVGQLDLPAAAVWAWQERHFPPALVPRAETERAWLCLDDPAPAASGTLRFAGSMARRAGRALSRHGRRLPGTGRDTPSA